MTLIHQAALRIRLREGTIHRICNDLDCSRDELARRLGVSTGSAYKIDSGRVDPSPTFMARLMQLTGQGFDDLFVVVEDAA